MAKMGRPKADLALTDAERVELDSLARRRKSAQAIALRARIVQECAKGQSNTVVASRLGITNGTAGKWRQRFVERRIDGLFDEPRPGAPRKVSDAKVEEVVTKTLETMPANATHWSSRPMAKKMGISPSTVQRIWRAFGLRPHKHETFSISTDPQFVTKVRDIVGLYMNPPDNAVVLSMDEKSGIQALDRRQPLIPMYPGQAERGNFDYLRHGTTSLFAALDVATGNVLGKLSRRHRSREFLEFLRDIDRAVPVHLQIHVILDNLATHKSPAIKNWLARHKRFRFHFTPTHSSWLNLVESWFSLLARKKLHRGVHTSVKRLEEDIRSFIKEHNRDPHPFRWTKTADEIIEAVGRFCARTLEVFEEKD